MSNTPQWLKENTHLGKETVYSTQYQPSLLVPVPRKMQRELSQITESFYGIDRWFSYEFSWLNQQGKPEIAIICFDFDCDSPHLIESKSFKLYLNSFHQTHFSSADEVQNLLIKDLSQASGKKVIVKFFSINQALNTQNILAGICLDKLDVTCNEYQANANLLKVKSQKISEKLYTHLFKSNCPITGQPDWASIYIEYRGNLIEHASLLRYLVSYRQHQDFHEHCVEDIFSDIQKHCQPEELTVIAYFTRRGGLDINPFRSSKKNFEYPMIRLARQ